MNVDWQKDLRMSGSAAATFFPPATIEETAWDILLALYSEQGCELGLDKLARMVSVRQPVLDHKLAMLEQRQLIAGARHELTGERRAVLTPAGRERLDRYLSATSDLQVGAQH